MNQFKAGNNKADSKKQRKNNPNSSSIDPCRNKNVIGNSGEANCPYKQDKWPSRIIAGSTVIIMIITFFYMIYAKEQSIYMKDAVNIASDTAIRQLRAYISVDSIRIENVANPLPADVVKGHPSDAKIFIPTRGPICHIILKNSGQTPAYSVNGWADLVVREYPLNSPLPEKHSPMGTRGIFAPNGTYNIYPSIPKPLTNEEIIGLRQGSKAIYIFGETAYVDIFKKTHHIKFISMHSAHVGPIGVSTATACLEEDAD